MFVDLTALSVDMNVKFSTLFFKQILIKFKVLKILFLTAYNIFSSRSGTCL